MWGLLVTLSLSLSLSLSLYLSLSLSACVSVCVSICESVCLSFCLSFTYKPSRRGDHDPAPLSGHGMVGVGVDLLDGGGRGEGPVHGHHPELVDGVHVEALDDQEVLVELLVGHAPQRLSSLPEKVNNYVLPLPCFYRLLMDLKFSLLHHALSATKHFYHPHVFQVSSANSAF